MTYLVRIKAGLFDIDEAATLEEIEAEPMRYVLSVDTAIQELRKVTLPAAGCASLLQGRPVPFAGKGLPPDVVLRIYNPEDKLAGIARFDKEHHVIRPHKMFADVL
jgi:tRNA pseudouridine55 synthase